MPDVDLDAGSAQNLAASLLLAWGAPSSVADAVASHLVGADLCGHASHGVSRLPWYRRYVDEAVVCPAALPTVTSDGGSRHGIVKVSANWGFGQPAGNLAVDLATARAHEHGVGAVAVVQTTHLGRLGAYVERGTDRGCVVITTVGGMRGAGITVPFGGSAPLLGPSPFAIGFPTEQGHPVLMDISTTEVPLGKVMIAKASGARLPVLGLVEADGTRTDDPSALDRGGALATFGGHKGFALATIADLLGGALTGAFTHRDDGFGGPAFRSAGMLVMAIAADAFCSADAVESTAARLQREIRDIPPAPGMESVLAPGDPEAAARRAAGGRIRIPAVLWQQIADLASASNLEIPVMEVVTR
ncbi:MAG: Ldh family oxidoreductase [Actinomycetales bacterium]